MSEWLEASLSELSDIRVSNVDKKVAATEKTVRLCNYMDVYSKNYIRVDMDFMEATATSSEVARFKIDRGDVLITKDSETPSDIGVPAVVTDLIENLVCGYHLALIRPNKELIDSVYLSKQLSSERTARYFGRYAAGSTRYGLSNSAIANAKIPLAPLANQKKIAAILICIDTAIEKTEALIDKYRKIKAGLMYDLFTRGVLPNGQLRPPREQAPELYQETAIGWIPREWEVSGLAIKARAGTSWIRTGPFGSSLKGEHWKEYGYPVITIGALGEGGFNEEELLFVGGGDAVRLVDFQLKMNDVVFSRVADVGRSAVIRDEQVGWIMSSNLMRISLDESAVRSEYLQMQLTGDARLKSQIRAKVNSGGRDVANTYILSRLRFVWPSIAEQDRIVALLSGVTKKLNIELIKKAKLYNQKIGLMQDLLTGKVPVKVDAPMAETVDA